MAKVLLVGGVSLALIGLLWGLYGDFSPAEPESYYQVGVASWYGSKFDGQKTASGEIFDMDELTAAHKSLPFGTVVRVYDLGSGSSVRVEINDRGPFVEGRVIDLSRAAAERLGIVGSGTAKVGLVIERWGKETG